MLNRFYTSHNCVINTGIAFCMGCHISSHALGFFNKSGNLIMGEIR